MAKQCDKCGTDLRAMIKHNLTPASTWKEYCPVCDQQTAEKEDGMSEHERLYERAVDALSHLSNDPSVGIEQTIGSLCALSDEINTRLASMKEAGDERGK